MSELNLVYDFSGVGLFVLAVVIVGTILEYVLSMSTTANDVEMASNNNNLEDSKKMQTKKTRMQKFDGKISLKTYNKLTSSLLESINLDTDLLQALHNKLELPALLQACR